MIKLKDLIKIMTNPKEFYLCILDEHDNMAKHDRDMVYSQSTDEFLKFYKVGQVIHLKNKNDNLEQLTSIVAVFIRCYCCVCLGINHGALAFEDLFKKYEIEIDGKWQPFGVLDESEV